MDENKILVPQLIDPRYYHLFMIIFYQCLNEGYDCNSARNYASLELTKKEFHNI
jgi:hypothetical protein